MLRRLFSRNVGFCYVFTTVFLVLFFVYEMKQAYNKFQKGRRFAFYNIYVNEVYHFADKLELLQNKSSDDVRQLTKVFKTPLKKNSTIEGR